MRMDKGVAYHFDRPARIWEETFPLGNGRVGMMPDGGIDRETILLNEISLWSGSKQDADNPDAYASLAAIRRLLFEGHNDEAQDLMYRTFVCKGQGSALGDGANAPYGSYQLLGNLTIDHVYPNATDSVSAYRRTLDLQEAVASVSFKRGNIGFMREAFTSFAGDVGVVHLAADADKALHFSLGMNRPEHALVTTQGNDLIMRGQLPDGVDTLANQGMRYVARVRVVLPKGGSVVTTDSQLVVRDASEATVLVSMATDYWDKTRFEAEATARLEAAAGKEYDTLRKEHTAAYQAFFNRVEEISR